MPLYLNHVPPYCAPFECSDIYQFSTLLPQLSFIRLGDDALFPQPDTLHDGFEKINANFKAVHDVLRHFSGNYGKYRKNLAITYSLSTFHPGDQASKPMQVGDALYYTASAFHPELPDGGWRYAQAISGAPSEALGVVTDVTCDCFTMTLNGYVSASWPTPLLPGATYFLNASTPGQCTMVNPTAPFTVSKPMFTAISSNEAIIDIKRGVLVANYSVWS